MNANGLVRIVAAPEGQSGYIGHYGEARLSAPGDDPVFMVLMDNGLNKRFLRSQLEWVAERNPEVSDSPAKPTVVGFVGLIGHGKDFVADAMMEYDDEREWKKEKFGDGVREALVALDPYVSVRGAPEGVVPMGDETKAISAATLIQMVGYETAKRVPDFRRLMQRQGTEAGREIHGEQCWVDLLKRKVRANTEAGVSTAVTDVRFVNEVEAIHSLGGVVINVLRPDDEGDVLGRVSGTRPEHASERLAWDLATDAPSAKTLDLPVYINEHPEELTAYYLDRYL